MRNWGCFEKFVLVTIILLFSSFLCSQALAEEKEVKIGVIWDYTGPYAAGGSEPGAVGTKIAIDMINERGGVEGYKIVPIYADAQSKVDVAINEAERLVDQEKVDLLLGFFSSGECVPLAAKMDTQKKFMWADICVSSAVFKNKNLKYVFRPQVHSDTYGLVSPDFIAHYAKSKLGKDVKDVRVAIIYEDGPYGSGIAAGNEIGDKGPWHEHCAEGGVFGHRTGFVIPGHEAETGASGCHFTYGLQSRYHLAAPSGTRAGS